MDLAGKRRAPVEKELTMGKPDPFEIGQGW